MELQSVRGVPAAQRKSERVELVVRNNNKQQVTSVMALNGFRSLVLRCVCFFGAPTKMVVFLLVFLLIFL